MKTCKRYNVEENEKEHDKKDIKRRDGKKGRNLGTFMISKIADSKNAVIFIENKLEEDKHKIVHKDNRMIIQPAGSNFE